MRIIKILWVKWRKFGKKAGNFQALVLFTIFYFIILWMIGIAVAFFSDPLNIKKSKKKSNFSLWPHQQKTIEEAQKAY